jgi:drug/metabolite transporter (DMT)-like permease
VSEPLSTGGFAHDASRAKSFAPGRRRAILADLSLLLVTLIWGSTFVMVKDAVADYPVFGFLTLRFGIATLILAPAVVWRKIRRPIVARQVIREPAAAAPILLGLALFAGFAFQTAGLHLTTPAKAGFITGMAVVLVPVGSALLLKQAPDRAAWWGVGLAATGLALLSLNTPLSVDPGDLLVLGCAVSFAAHILLTGRFAPGQDMLYLLFGQVVMVAMLSALASLALEERPPLQANVLFAAVFTGLFATVLAFGIQTVAQRFTSATHTALIFAAEPVFAAIFSLLLIGEVLGPRQILGCALILAGMIVAEFLPAARRAPRTANVAPRAPFEAET